MEDEAILKLYFARDERAVQETERKYGRYCFMLADTILHNREDSEETVSDTWLKTWNAIPPKKPDVLKLFLAKITRNLAFTRWRGYSAQKRGGGELDLVLDELGQCVAAPGQVEDHLNGKELALTIRAFLDTLPEKEQNIFLRRYFFVEDSEEIARRYGMKRATVLRTLSRTREKLRAHLRKEGYGV